MKAGSKKQLSSTTQFPFSRKTGHSKTVNELPPYDLDRLKWLDPCCEARFIREEPTVHQGDSTDAVLQNIVCLADEIFNHLSVLEQFPETTARGAKADPKRRIDCLHERARLMVIERELWRTYLALKRKRKLFVERQLQSVGIKEGARRLRVHIGSGAQPLKSWLNIDAGGADLMVNVNWGLPLRNGCAEFVYTAHLLEHLRYSDQAPVFVREIYRILVKGGTARFVVPDLKQLLVAYATNDRKFFESRKAFYPLSKGFTANGIASLDYILLFCGAGPQTLNYNHKFGYDSTTLRKLLLDAGFSKVHKSVFQRSSHVELRVDNYSYNANARDQDRHYSLFMEATK